MVHLKVCTQARRKCRFRVKSFYRHVYSYSDSWKSGSPYISRREIGSKGPINTHQCPGECVMLGFIAFQLKSQPLALALLSPRGWNRVSERNHIAPPAVWTHQTNHPDTINELGYYTAALCKDLSLLSVSICSILFLFLPKCSGVNNVCVCKEREKHTNWKQRRVCSPCCG